MQYARVFFNQGVATAGSSIERVKAARCSEIWIRAPRFESFSLKVKIFASIRKDHWVLLCRRRSFEFLVITSWNPSSSNWGGGCIHVVGEMKGGLPRIEISVGRQSCGRDIAGRKGYWRWRRSPSVVAGDVTGGQFYARNSNSSLTPKELIDKLLHWNPIQLNWVRSSNFISREPTIRKNWNWKVQFQFQPNNSNSISAYQMGPKIFPKMAKSNLWPFPRDSIFSPYPFFI